MRTACHACLVAIMLTGTIRAEEPLARYEFQQLRMGVPFRLVLYARDQASANEGAEAAFERVAELDRVMSDYDRQSELMRLCRRSGPGRPVTVSGDLLHVLCRALRLSERTNGAFDVTVGPLVQLWRRSRRQKELPDPQRLAEARRRVGWRSMRIDSCAKTVELLQENMRLDLGGIAKGYAGDAALRTLAEHGITRALIDGGGDIVVGEAPPGQSGWRIGIAPLTKPDAPPSRYLTLANASVATSGDAFQFVELDGVRYSHIIDPQTGLGLTRRMSVTVVAADGITADSLASAVSVLGPRRGITLVEQTRDAAAFVVEIAGGRSRTFASRRLSCYEAPLREPPRGEAVSGERHRSP